MLLASAAPLALELMGGQPAYPAEKALTNVATNLGTQGQALSSYIQSGTLPPGGEAFVKSSTDAAKAATRSNYARMGLSGSSMETAALADIDQRAGGQRFALAGDLLSQGLRAEDVAAGDYKALITAEQARDTAFSNALSRFASALAGGFAGRNLYPGEQPTSAPNIG
jgi:hypothetical protein